MIFRKDGTMIVEDKDRPRMPVEEYLQSPLLSAEIHHLRDSEMKRVGYEARRGAWIIERQEKGEVVDGE